MFGFFKNLFTKKEVSPADVSLKEFLKYDSLWITVYIYKNLESAPSKLTDHQDRGILHTSDFVFGYDSHKGKYKILKNRFNGSLPEFYTYGATVGYLDSLYLLSRVKQKEGEN